jgi:hypothetical protein
MKSNVAMWKDVEKVHDKLHKAKVANRAMIRLPAEYVDSVMRLLVQHTQGGDSGE